MPRANVTVVKGVKIVSSIKIHHFVVYAYNSFLPVSLHINMDAEMIMLHIYIRTHAYTYTQTRAYKLCVFFL